MRKFRTRILVGGGVAVFAAATAFALTTTAGATTTTQAGATQAAATRAAATRAAATRAAALTTTTAKTGTALSATERRAAIKAGQRDVITGTLTRADGKPTGRRVVELYRYNAKTKKWLPVQVFLSRKGGAVRFIVRPLVTAQYELKYHGNAALAASQSVPVTVTVTK